MNASVVIYDAEEVVPPPGDSGRRSVDVIAYDGNIWFRARYNYGFRMWTNMEIADPDQRVVGVTHWFYPPSVRRD